MVNATAAVADEGYVKFQCERVAEVPAVTPAFKELQDWRRRLVGLGLIGMYPNGVGFGNISVRQQANGFLITGTATGSLPEIDIQHCARVVAYDLDKNWTKAVGLVVPSSECMTHAAIYESDPTVMAVIHVHNLELWEQWRFVAPTTGAEAAYGTPAMAREVQRLFSIPESQVRSSRFIVMGGHEKGIVTFGNSMSEAGEVLLGHLQTTTV